MNEKKKKKGCDESKPVLEKRVVILAIRKPFQRTLLWVVSVGKTLSFSVDVDLSEPSISKPVYVDDAMGR
jgi:hypothetical protein